MSPRRGVLDTGDPSKRTGLFALDEVDLFNLMCLPGVGDFGILSEAANYCQARRAFLIVDPPDGQVPMGPSCPLAGSMANPAMLSWPRFET